MIVGRAHVCVCARASVRACLRACLRACVLYLSIAYNFCILLISGHTFVLVHSLKCLGLKEVSLIDRVLIRIGHAQHAVIHL